MRDPAGEDWLSANRDYYRHAAVEVFEHLLNHLCESENPDAGVKVGEQLVTLDPLRESSWRALMQIYHDAGDRNHALKAYQRCTEVLKHELGVEPSDETTALQTAIRNGTVAPAVSVSHNDSNTTSSYPSTEVDGTVSPAQSLSGKPSIVVLPFVSLGTESEHDYLADGLTVDVMVSLSRYRELLVIDHGSAFAFRDSDTDTEQFARRVDVIYVVKGSVRKSSGRFRVSVQLLQAATGRNIWADHFEESFEEVFALNDAIASRIATTLVGHIEEESRNRTAGKPPRNMTAFECVARARPIAESWDEDDNLLARRLLVEAIERDPEYAPAYAYLARTYLTEFYCTWCDSPAYALERGVEFARKALSFDEFDSNAHAVMGRALVSQKNYVLAEVHLNRAIECNPNEYNAFCSTAWLMAMTGRSEECIACGSVSHRLNPLMPDDCLWSFAVAHFRERRYLEALEALDRMHFPDGSAEAWRAACLAQLGHDVEAHEAARRAIELDGEFIRHLDWQTYFPYKDPGDLEHLLDGLRKAGL